MEEPPDENSNTTAVLGEDVVLREREQLSDLLQLLPLRAQLGFSGLKNKWNNRGDKGLKDMISVAAKTNDPLMVEYTCLDVTSKSIVFGSNLGIVYMYDRATRRLSKFICDQKQVPITSVKLLESRSFVATGQFNGAVTLFQYGEERNGLMKVNLKCTVESHHLTPITSIQWTPDGMKLFTADSEGNVAITVINMDEGKTHTVFICKEDSPIVQLSFSHSALLISTLRRTLIWPFTTKKIVQVGMQERKVFGNFGACFFPEAGLLPTDEVVDVYAARPGLRLWRATNDGKVLSTMMFRESINKGKPEIQTIDLLSNLPVSTHGEQRQFGPIKTFHDQFLITWQGSNVWVLDPTTGVVVGCHSNLGCVVDVGVVDNEIFVLSKAKENFVRRILFEDNPCIVVEELDLNNPTDVMKAQRHGSVNQFEDQDRIDKILDEVGNKMGRAFFDVKTRVKGIKEQIRSREVSEDDRGSESDRFSSPKAYYKKDVYGERCLATSEGYSTGNGNSTDENDDFSDRPFESSSNESFSSPSKSLNSSKSPLLNDVTVNETDSIPFDGLAVTDTNVKNDASDSGQVTPTNDEGQNSTLDQTLNPTTMDVILTHKRREKEAVFSHLSKKEFANDIVFEGTSVSTTRKKKKKKAKKANDAKITDRLSTNAAFTNVHSSNEHIHSLETTETNSQSSMQPQTDDNVESNSENTEQHNKVESTDSDSDIQQKKDVVQQTINVVEQNGEMTKHFHNQQNSNDIQQHVLGTQLIVDNETDEVGKRLTNSFVENKAVELEKDTEIETLVDGVNEMHFSKNIDCIENGETTLTNGQKLQLNTECNKPIVTLDDEKDKTLSAHHENNIDNSDSREGENNDKALSKPADEERTVLELNNTDSGVNTSVEDSPHLNGALSDNNISVKNENELSLHLTADEVSDQGLLSVTDSQEKGSEVINNADLNSSELDVNFEQNVEKTDVRPRVKNIRPTRQISSSSDEDAQPYVNNRISLNLSLDDEEPYYSNRPSPLLPTSTKPKLVADSSFDMNVVNVKISHKRQGSNVSVASLTERCREIKGEAIEHNTTPKKAPVSTHHDSLEANLQPHHEPLTVEHHRSADESDEDGKLYPVSPFPPPQTTQSIYSQRSVSLSELSFERTQDLGDEDEKLLEDMMEYDRIDIQNDLIESIDSITDVEDNDSPPPVDINNPDSKAIATPKRKRKKKTRNSYPSSPSSSDLEGRPVNTKDSAAPEAIRDRLRYLADSWAGVVLPEKCGQIQSIACSSQLVWLIDNSDQVYYSPAGSTQVYTWKKLESKAMHISTNQNGSIVWCIDRNNVVHYRIGIKESTPQGTQWEPFEKNIHYIAADKDSVWILKENGDVVVRTGVSNQRPSGTTWIIIKENSDLVQIACMDGIVWALDIYNHVQIFQGDLRTLSVSHPADHDLSWVELPGIAASHVTLGSKAVCWIIDKDNQIWFNQDVSRENPTGGNWYQLSLGENRSDSADWFSSVLSYFTKGNEPKQIMANDMAGVMILGKQGSIHVAHGHLLGTTWQSAVPTQIKSSGCWTCISAGGADMNKGYIWALQPNGQLICFKSGRQTYNVHPPNRVVLKYCSAGPRSLWALTSGQDVYVRLGISDTCPQGLKWLKVDMLAQGNRRLMNISAGNHVVWAVDFEGNAWFQMGREDRRGAGYAPAWVPVEGCPLDGSKFTKIVAGPDDLIVWACDNKNNVYARKDITENFWVGTSWEVVSGTSGKDLAISNNHVWSLCPNGDVLCRFGVSPNNVCGDYWKKVPGNFEKISVSANDELWGIDRFGHLYQRETLLFYGNSLSCRAPSYDDLFSDHNDWEFI